MSAPALVDEWSKIGLKVTQQVVPTGPWFEAMRTGNFDVTVEAGCSASVNPLLDVSKDLPQRSSPRITATTTTTGGTRSTTRCCTSPTRQSSAS